TLGAWLAEGPFALAMSSGFFGFFAHCGMLSALTARRLAPARVGGSSAGALVAGTWAGGLAPDDLGALLLGLERAHFWDPRPGLGLLAGRKFDALLREALPVDDLTATRVPLHISVFDILARRTHVLARGDLPTAIRASCALPGLFHPVWIDRRPYWDGGVLDRPGLAGMPPGRTLFHHLASRSPWRREGSAALALPRRPALVTLVLADLPRSGPFKLDAGRRALELAREATDRALDQPILDDVVRA
ncbi:MAG TPA: patatin-like phospholipase family protein, partial [Kofleriaceae bacterium]|nr:patatin-like phospholipase family protein [Kofleriaceae bacterium]